MVLGSYGLLITNEMLFEWHTHDTVLNMRLLNTLSSSNSFGYHYCIYMDIGVCFSLTYFLANNYLASIGFSAE